jgi:hypothetical protein
VKSALAGEYVEQALESGRVILHTMGEHAGESPDVFLARKKADIADSGLTYWYARSVQPPRVRQFCADNDPTYVLFYETAPEHRRRRNGKLIHAGAPTKTTSPRFGYMTHYCEGDRSFDHFFSIPGGMQRVGRFVTGLVDAGACGFVFDFLSEVESERSFNPTEWISPYPKSSQAGAWCAHRGEATAQKTWYIVAVARLHEPYGIWFQGKYGLPPT